MQTGHLASSHSFTSFSVSEDFLGEDRFPRLELQGKGDALYLSKDTDRSLLSFGMFRCRKYQQKTKTTNSFPNAAAIRDHINKEALQISDCTINSIKPLAPFLKYICIYILIDRNHK